VLTKGHFYTLANAPRMVAESPSHLGDLFVPPALGAAVGVATGAVLLHFGGDGSPVALIACAVLGLLYAVCQHRTHTLGFLLVGVFYGVMIWITTKLLAGVTQGVHWPLSVKGVPCFYYCQAFTGALALTGLICNQVFAQKTTTVPKD
jgi:hypothetical protein